MEPSTLTGICVVDKAQLLVGEREINGTMRSLGLGSLFGRDTILYVLELMVTPVGIPVSYWYNTWNLVGP